ncbi:MAG: hypothetical protein HGA24_03460, partial [Candidatus Aminicenantes bacterium]|nr:hypothetical protein [Candidatus Aminicenantes bacterium]
MKQTTREADPSHSGVLLSWRGIPRPLWSRRAGPSLAWQAEPVEKGPEARLTVYGEYLEHFPPTQILDQVRSQAGEVAYVIPVSSPGREWGLLTLVAGIDVDS